MTETLHITLAQINPTVGDLDYNLGKIRESWDAASEDTDLIVFPEMVVCGYPPEDLVLKPFFLDEIERTVETLVQDSKNHSAAIILPTPWRIKGKTYNAAHLIYEGKIQATITKHHLPNYGVFDEKRIFEPGPLPAPIAFKGFKLGLMLCEDMWYEDAAKSLKDAGADILIVPNASPFDIDKTTERIDYATARVKETGLSLIYVNQIGGQDELVFDGGSFALDGNSAADKGTSFAPESNSFPILQMASFLEGLGYVKLNGENQGITSDGEGAVTPALSENEAIYQALTLGLRDYIGKNGFPGVLIGLSGGIDSALSAAIAVDALGADKVHCVMMPSKFTSDESLEDAAELAKNLGIKLDTIFIEPTIDTLNPTILSYVKLNEWDSTATPMLENIQSRTRGLILMALSNASGKMVLSTGNKSEMAVGYATLYGDMCGGFNALKDVYKTQVYALSRWRNTQEATIPERIITKAPTAELKDNQTDQDTLPPYDDLDVILHNAIELEKSPEEIIALGYNAETVHKTLTMLDRAEYKRRQAPPGIKITSRAFGRERRYPITNGFVNFIEK